MAGRNIDPNSKYRVYLQRTNGYSYAAIQEPFTDEMQKKKYKTIHLGTIGPNMTFIPNNNYMSMPLDEQEKLIFPENWNLMNIKKDKSNNQPQSEENHLKIGLSFNNIETYEYRNRLYGSFWLLEQIARKIGLYNDLLTVFDNNYKRVNELLSLAFFPYLSGRNYNRFARWQNTHKTLTDYQMTSPYISKLTRILSDNDRMLLIKLRISRQPKNACLDCDSTTKSAWGKCLADIHWGYNKDNPKLKNTTEVIIYSLTTHEPIYYRLFPGNTSDVSTIRTILADLKELGLNEVIFMTDRGFISEENIAQFSSLELPFIMAAKISNSPISKLLLEIKYDDNGIPIDMEYNKEKKIYMKQVNIPDYIGVLPNGTEVEVSKIKANIYLNMHKRVDELAEISLKISEELQKLKEDKKNNYIPSSIKKYNSLFEYFRVKEIKNENEKITGFMYEECTEKIQKERSQCGFFSSIIHIIDKNPLECLAMYKRRDEHEKNFNLLKDKMFFNLQRSSTEGGKNGRALISFIGLIPISILQNAWSSTLSNSYNSVYDMLDEMESIRFSEYPNRKFHITSFTKKQVEISRSCGIEPPHECIPKSMR